MNTSRPPAPPARASTALSARNVSKQYAGRYAVRALDLAVPQGTIFGFIGPSGSGKTTTVRLLTGIHQPDEGRVEVLGIPPSALTPAERARIGYLPQLSVLFPTLSLLGNLNFVASIYGMPLRRKRRLRDTLEFLELWDDRHKRLRDASGGMQRRLALAAALVHDPELLFLDEPTSGIDPILRRKLWDRFEGLRDEGTTLFVTTQYVGDAASCDLVGVLDEGRVVTVDTPDGLRRRAYGGEILDLQAAQPLDLVTLAELRQLDIVRRCDQPVEGGPAARVVVDRADEAIPRIVDWFDESGLALESISQHQPPFDDVFVALLEGRAS